MGRGKEEKETNIRNVLAEKRQCLPWTNTTKGGHARTQSITVTETDSQGRMQTIWGELLTYIPALSQSEEYVNSSPHFVVATIPEDLGAPMFTQDSWQPVCEASYRRAITQAA